MDRYTPPLVAVLGGGQLGRMLGLAGVPLGLGFRFLDPSSTAPAQSVGLLVVGALDDDVSLLKTAEHADVVTYEWEGVPAGARAPARGPGPHHPPVDARARDLPGPVGREDGLPGARHPGRGVRERRDLRRPPHRSGHRGPPRRC